LGRAYVRRICQSERESHRPRKINERPVEYAFALEWINRAQPKTVLDVGTGESALPSIMATCGCRVDAIDNVRDYWTRKMVNRHWPVADEDIVSPRNGLLLKQYDMVTCISVLEHIEYADAAVANMLAVLRPGGHLVLTHPYSDDPMYRHFNVYEIPGSYGADSAYKASQYSRPDLNRWFTDSEVVSQRYYRAFNSRFWSVGELVRPIERVPQNEPHQLTCLVIRKPTE
jgi:SAM-dependent methyltransferase